MENDKSPLILSTFFRNMVRYLPSRIFPPVIGLIAIPIITRLFEPDVYGNYILVLATVSGLSLIPTTLLGTAALRFFPQYEKENSLETFRGTFIKGTFLCVTGIAVGFFISLQIIKPTIPVDLYSLMSIGIILFVAISIFSTLTYLLIARQKATEYSRFTTWHAGAGLLFGLAIVFWGNRGTDGLVWGSAAALTIAIPFLYRTAFNRLPSGRSTFSKTMAVEMAKYSAPLIIATLAAWIMNFSDRYVIELYRGSYEMGLYSASYSISYQALSMFGVLFTLAGYPLIVNMWENEGKTLTQQLVGRLTRYYILLVIPAAVGLTVLSKPIITVFTDSAYHEGYLIIPLIAFGTLLLGLQWWAQLGLNLYKKTNISAYCVLSAGLLNIGLNLWLVPKYGYIAAAVTTLVSYAFLLVATAFASKRFFTWEFPFKSLARIVVASAVMGWVVYHVADSLTSSSIINLAAGILLGIVINCAMLILLRELKWNSVWLVIKQIAQETRNLNRKG
ncbi:MAG: flippase [Dehalococcoidales bacterium]|nr:flippase [Dehalococcoidales bacterium]